MGMLFNSQGTLEVLAALNAAFGEESIASMRTIAIKNLFADNQKLAKASYKLGIWPGVSDNDRKAKRWFKFLKELDSKNSSQHEKIRTSIKSALDDANATAIKFMAAEAGNTYATSYTIPEDPKGSPYVVFILLVTTVMSPDDEGVAAATLE